MTLKRHYHLYLTLAAFFAALPFAARATLFFSDTFSNGSTLTNVSPANPASDSTAYQYLTGGRTFPSWLNLSANDLRIGTTSGSSVIGECQALFTTNPIVLAVDGDYIQITVTFTNYGQLFSGAASLGLGLFNSGGANGSVKPVPGGLNSALTLSSNTAPTGFAQNWKGYFGSIVTNGTAHKIYNRTIQTGTGNNNQGTVTSGTSSSPQNPNPTALSGVGISASPTIVNLTMGATYTEVLAIVRNGANSLAITNTLYSGADTSGSVVVSFGAIATNTTWVTSAFDSLSFGYRATTGITNDISSIKVDGSTTVIAAPPTITQQPAAASVSLGGSVPFFVSATGNNVVYQWCRNGTNLVNGGNISGATSATLILTNVGSGDFLSGNNGYYCTVSELGGASTNTITNSLIQITVNNLVWNGSSGTWDLTNTASWNVGATPTVFNYGDSVTFDDTGAANANVILASPFLSARKTVFAGTTAYALNGPGYIGGSGQLIFNSSATTFQLNNITNTYTGGTIISNNVAGNIYCGRYQALSTGPLILAKTNQLEFATSGNASLGIAGDVIVNDDFVFQFDGSGAFAGVFQGNISGTVGKTLYLAPQSQGVSRYRVQGTNTVCNANISINPNGNPTTNALYDGTLFAPYESSGSQIYNGVISGYGGVLVKNAGGSAGAILNQANTYSGGTTIAQGTLGVGNDAALGTGQLNLASDAGSTTGSGTIYAYGGGRTIANAVNYPSGTNNLTLIVGGTNSITFTANIDLNGLDNTGNPGTRTITANNTAATTLSGAISDSSVNAIGFVKNGTGTLHLNGANTYSGLTTISGGVLAGSGNVAGNVLVASGGSIGAGPASGIGTLTIGGNLVITNGGAGFFRLAKTPGLTNDKVSVTGSITNYSTNSIVVTNVGANAFVSGDKFYLFNKSVSGASTMSVTGGLSSGLIWSNSLAADGSIQVITGVSLITNSPVITNITLSGNNIIISGTNGQTGGTCYLLSTTNLAVPRNQWKTVSTNVLNGNNYTLTGTNAVTAGSAQQFYMLSSTNYNP